MYPPNVNDSELQNVAHLYHGLEANDQTFVRHDSCQGIERMRVMMGDQPSLSAGEFDWQISDKRRP